MRVLVILLIVIALGPLVATQLSTLLMQGAVTLEQHRDGRDQ